MRKQSKKKDNGQIKTVRREELIEATTSMDMQPSFLESNSGKRKQSSLPKYGERGKPRQKKAQKLSNLTLETTGNGTPPSRMLNDVKGACGNLTTGRHSRMHLAGPGNSGRGRNLDAETLQYFTEISTLLGAQGSIKDPEEWAALHANALEETHGKELELSCDKSCSRVLEMLVSSSDGAQISSFLHRASPYFVSMANDAFGSHVAESLLRSASGLLHGNYEAAGWYKTFKQALVTVAKVMGGSIVDVMTDCHGSHVIRSLLSLLSGSSLESSDKSHRRKWPLSVDVEKKAPKQDFLFPIILNSLVDKMLQAASQNLSVLIRDPFAGPVLQTVLKILIWDSTMVTKAIQILLVGNANGVDKQEKKLLTISPGHLKELICDSTSSHLVEVMLEVAPDGIYNEMFKHIAMNNLVEFALHGSANFVVQTLLTFVRHQDQLTLLYKELSPSFWTIIKQMRSGVIISLLVACKRFGVLQQEACRALAKALNTESVSPLALAPRLLFLENYAKIKNVEDWKPCFGKKMSVLGCAILQLIFSFPEEINQQYWLSLVSMESSDLLATVTDPGGCHVVEKFLSSNVPSKHKQKVIFKLKEHFGELALNTSSAFTVDKCCLVAKMDLKEAIAAELATVQSNLAKTKHGPHLLKKWDIAGYSRSPQQWHKNINAKQETMRAFSNIFL